MKLGLPRRSHRDHPRGQGLVEFALILPLLVLLLVMAIDFGRVFFGWVALHNAVRIGADYAAVTYQAWEEAPAFAEKRQHYEDLILNDLQSLNCTLPSPDPVPEPVFSGFSDGDLVQAEVSCSFGLITPLAESILGGPVSMTVRTEFAVNRTIIAGLPDFGGPLTPPGCEEGEIRIPQLVGERMEDAEAIWAASDFTGSFSPAVTNPTKNKVVITQTPAATSCQPEDADMEVTHS